MCDSDPIVLQNVLNPNNNSTTIPAFSKDKFDYFGNAEIKASITESEEIKREKLDFFDTLLQKQVIVYN